MQNILDSSKNNKKLWPISMEYICPKINQKALNLKWSHYIWKLGSTKMIEN